MSSLKTFFTKEVIVILYYATGLEKTEEDYEMLLQEVKAYRQLYGQTFGFCEELDIENVSNPEYELLKRDEEILEEMLKNWDSSKSLVKKQNKYQKTKKLKHQNKTLEQAKLKKIANMAWWPVYYNEESERYIRCYYSRKRKYAKICSNKIVRKAQEFSLKGAGYRKLFDYWWEIF